MQHSAAAPIARTIVLPRVHFRARRSDLVPLGRQHRCDGRFKILLQKIRAHKKVTIELPVLPDLTEVISASPTSDLAFLVAKFGRPFTSNRFGNWFRRRRNEAKLEQCSAHGLREAGAVRAAENGATTHELMAIFGWRTVKEAERYTQAAQRRRLASGATRLLASPSRAEK